MSLLPHQIELLSPARTAEIGKEAILHGADAVYIGGPSFGARHNACNSVSEIADLVEFAHRYHARIFVTLNTILHDAELDAARQLIWQFYDAGVDALIIQDMGILEMDLPPIQLHASTQCDIRTPEKARFLADSGFSQIVLARELTIPQIERIKAQVEERATIEYFIHGALCVAFSGQCYISHAENGRSANRGDCSQACRLPYTLTDAQGGVVAFDKHLLSMKDNNQSANLEALLDAGVRSLKIEGRYKEMGYVKNITAHYRQLLDEIMTCRTEWAPAASGKSDILFTPNPDKTFNRGSTDYFATGRKEDIGAFDSPKFVGVALGEVVAVGKKSFDVQTTEPMSNGDGINFMKKRDVLGIQVNTVELLSASTSNPSNHQQVWRVTPNDLSVLVDLKPGLSIHRNRDHAWEHALLKPSAVRKIDVWLTLSEHQTGLQLSAQDADGFSASIKIDHELTPAKDATRGWQQLSDSLGKLGNTIFNAVDIQLNLTKAWFVPNSILNQLRRDVIEQLIKVRLNAWQRPVRQAPVEPPVAYPEKNLTYLANVYNQLAWQFYRKHGVEVIDAAYEAHEELGEVPLMITKHCLRFSYNLCPKQAKGVQGVMGQVRAEPMTLKTGDETYTLRFDCKPCEMHVMGSMKKHILKSQPPSTVAAVAPLTFYKKRPNNN